MPELPDVEIYKQYVDATALHQPIDKVTVHNAQILEGTSVEALETALNSRSFESTRRHGKHLFVEVNGTGWLRLHFGMTAYLKYFKDEEKMPPHQRLLIDFKNGYHLAYDCQRLLGQVEIIEAIDPFLEKNELGPDALAPDFDAVAFKERVSKRRGMIKSTLMNQEVVAGIGNVYADEILFQSGLHPKTKANRLDEKQLDDLFQTMKAVLQTAIDHKADPDRLPDSYIIPRRHDEGRCPQCDRPLEQLKVSGRTSYLCPNHQPQPEGG